MRSPRHAEVADCPGCGRVAVLVCAEGQLRAHTTRARGPSCGYLDVIPAKDRRLRGESAIDDEALKALGV